MRDRIIDERTMLRHRNNLGMVCRAPNML